MCRAGAAARPPRRPARPAQAPRCRTSHRLKPDVYLPLNTAARKLDVSRQTVLHQVRAGKNATPSRSSTANAQAHASTPTALTTRCAESSPRQLIPRETLRWKALYRRRASVERQFGRLKNEWALAPLRVRRIERVRLHANLTVLSQLTRALNGERTLALAA
jgi:hypothetical protein